MNKDKKCARCGGALVEIKWCTEKSQECHKDCQTYAELLPCYMAEVLLRCTKCRTIHEPN